MVKDLNTVVTSATGIELNLIFTDNRIVTLRLYCTAVHILQGSGSGSGDVQGSGCDEGQGAEHGANRKGFFLLSSLKL